MPYQIKPVYFSIMTIAELDERLDFELLKTHVKSCNVHNETIVAFHEGGVVLTCYIDIILKV